MDFSSADSAARAIRSKSKAVVIEAVVEGMMRITCLCWMRSGSAVADDKNNLPPRWLGWIAHSRFGARRNSAGNKCGIDC